MFKITMILILSVLFTNAFADNDNSKTVMRMLDAVSQKYAPDQRTALFEVSFTEHSGQIILKGKTNLPQAKQAVLDSLSHLKINYSDSLIVLPEASMGENTWAIVTLSVANIRSGPDHATELVSQALMGTPVKVLEAVDGWYHIQTPEQYIGWVDETGIAIKTDSQMALWKKGKRFIFKQISGYAVDAPKRKASPVSDLVLGDLFESVKDTKKYLQMIFPDGRTAYVKKANCLAYEEWISQKPDVEAVLAVAKQLLGSAYLWGGTSCKGVDCSGMVKTAWYSQGVILARDASQQAKYGKHIDFNSLVNLQKGDLLFFGRSEQRITHVGIYLGNGSYIHASGMVRINSIDPNDPLYNITEQKKLVGATRIVDSVGNEGIVGVKEHPWYRGQ